MLLQLSYSFYILLVVRFSYLNNSIICYIRQILKIQAIYPSYLTAVKLGNIKNPTVLPWEYVMPFQILYKALYTRFLHTIPENTL